MKRVMCTICLLLIVGVGGCVSIYWYQPNKTLEQCLQASEECFVIADEQLGTRHSFFPQFTDATYYRSYRRCMQLQNYQLFDRKKLPAGIRMSKAIRYYPFAGE